MAAKNKNKKHNSNGQHGSMRNGSNPSDHNGDYHRSITNDNYTMESPLQLFGEAKEKINGLFMKLDTCVNKASQFYTDNQLDSEVLKSVDTARLQSLSQSIDTIRGVLSRNQMKVAFFGPISSGKSTVINAILHDKVLPMGHGHTTKCFLQIQGNPDNNALYEIQGDNDGKRPIKSVDHVAEALNLDSLEYSTLVKIHWPISTCPLLKYDVVLVDSPGASFKGNLDDWIDKHCHDADVFVLVNNAETLLSRPEQDFFHRVSEKLSKPNIFFLNNKWDYITAEGPESMDKLRAANIECAVSLLSDELKVSSPEEARQRTFFVSARETLKLRSPYGQNRQDASNINDRSLIEEFENFERKFEESLSKSAVKTKFKQHTDKGRETVDELSAILNNTKLLTLQVSQQKVIELRQCEDIFNSIQKLFYANEENIRKTIFETKKRVQIVSDSDFETEIRRLSRIVEDFDMEFSTNPDKINLYKEHLYKYVEESLSENLRSRINMVIKKHVNPFNKMLCDISLQLKPDRRHQVEKTVYSQTYVPDDLFDLSMYRQFYTEFQEDLEFRFSLGLVSIIRKFQRNSMSKSINSSLDHSQATLSSNTDFLSIVERFVMNPPQSPTTVGSLAIGGIIVRTVGWKVIVVTTVVYGALYAYEYLTWTNSAKERIFKAQYVNYAKKGLQDCVPIISQHVSRSVDQRMNLALTKVKEEVDAERLELSTRLEFLKNSLEKLQTCVRFTNELLGENDILLTELAAFASSYLHI